MVEKTLEKPKHITRTVLTESLIIDMRNFARPCDKHGISLVTINDVCEQFNLDYYARNGLQILRNALYGREGFEKYNHLAAPLPATQVVRTERQYANRVAVLFDETQVRDYRAAAQEGITMNALLERFDLPRGDKSFTRALFNMIYGITYKQFDSAYPPLKGIMPPSPKTVPSSSLERKERIKALHAAGYTGAAIAKELGCDASWVSLVINGKR